MQICWFPVADTERAVGGKIIVRSAEGMQVEEAPEAAKK